VEHTSKNYNGILVGIDLGTSRTAVMTNRGYIVPDIVDQLETLIMKFDPEDQEEALKNIILAGGGSRIRGLDRMIARQMKDYGEVVVSVSMTRNLSAVRVP